MEFKKEQWLWYIYPTKDITPIVKIGDYDLFILSNKPELYSFGFYHLTMMNMTHKIYKGFKVFVVDTKEFTTVVDKNPDGTFLCDNGNSYDHGKILSVEYSTDKALTFNLFCETPYPSPHDISLKNAVDHLNRQFLKKQGTEKTYTKGQVINEVINLIQLYSTEKDEVIDIRSWVQENIDL